MPQGNALIFEKTEEISESISESAYQALYEKSIADPLTFWAEQANSYLDWSSPFQKVMTGSLKEGNVRWFEGGTLNACYNCLDRHLPHRTEQIALMWESDSGNEQRSFTYEALYKEVCRFANVLKAHGIQKGDRICIYLPLIPEAVIAMLASARIGAIHSVVFAGFSSHALEERILNADCRLVVTADEAVRGGRTVPLKTQVDAALQVCPDVITVIVVKRTGNPVHLRASRDFWYHDVIKTVADDCPVVEMESNDPLFILYTSGSTGKPKGVLHGTGGYLLFAAMTHQWVFGCKPYDIYWCTADIGWITGHSYGVYGPLVNGVTTLLFEGIPTYPTGARYWQIIDKYGVNIFYTAPTALRVLMREGNAPVQSTSRKSLRVLGSVGEPLNPDVWKWYHQIVGEERCPIVDTWWQTETGGILMTLLPGTEAPKPGSVGRPFFGILPALVNDKGEILTGEASGSLVITKAWPGELLTIYGDKERFLETYLEPYAGFYYTGDGAYRDSEGYYQITGRIDDVLNVSGHRLGTAEIESALIAHPAIAEAGVVGYPHDIKGQGIYAFVVLMKNSHPSDALRKALTAFVAEQISPIARPDKIQFAPDLPKTRSGKIIRRILRKIAEQDFDSFGDISTLSDPDIVPLLIEGREVVG